MRVLHVITGLAAGGAETQLRLLLRHTRHDAEVVALYNAGSVAGLIRDDGIAVTDLGMRSNKQLGAALRLTRLIRRGGYDVIHTHLYRASLYGRLAGRLAGVPVIVATEHSLLDDQLEGRPATRGVRLLYRLGERCGRMTIAVSEAVRANLVRWGVAADRVVTVHNGLDLRSLAFDPAARAATRAELGIRDEAILVGAVGRLHPGKNFDELIRSLAPTLGPRRQLLLVGDGPERAELTTVAQGLGVAAHVHFVGEREPAPFLFAIDVLVSPSRSETFGLAVLEGLAAGLPVVHRRCPALEELGAPVPGAVQLGPDDDLRIAVDDALSRATARPRTCPAVLSQFDVRAVATAVDDIYEALAPAR